MENKRLELKLHEGIELKVTVENGVLVAEYSEEGKQELMVGDLAILWNDGDIACSCIKKIIRIIPRDDQSYLYCTEECAYENAIKCTSLEQYLEFIKS